MFRPYKHHQVWFNNDNQCDQVALFSPLAKLRHIRVQKKTPHRVDQLWRRGRSLHFCKVVSTKFLCQGHVWCHESFFPFFFFFFPNKKRSDYLGRFCRGEVRFIACHMHEVGINLRFYIPNIHYCIPILPSSDGPNAWKFWDAENWRKMDLKQHEQDYSACCCFYHGLLYCKWTQNNHMGFKTQVFDIPYPSLLVPLLWLA